MKDEKVETVVCIKKHKLTCYNLAATNGNYCYYRKYKIGDKVKVYHTNNNNFVTADTDRDFLEKRNFILLSEWRERQINNLL